MNDLSAKITEIFNSSVKTISNDKNCTSHSLHSNSMSTSISCNYDLCSEHLTKFSITFNDLLKASQNNFNKSIKAYILEDTEIFEKIDSLFLNPDWSTNSKIDNFNIATHNTSGAKCTKDEKFYIIRCYDHFYYIYNTEANSCLMAVKNEKKALTMINILLLTPYILYGDLYAVHGGLVSDGKNNILLSNASLGGKTTFAILFLANKWQIITEETTYITKYGEILNYNIRNYFNIRVGTYLEFKDFFANIGLVNNSFMAMEKMPKNELFEFGKKEQMTIYFEDLSKNGGNMTNNKVTHALNVSIEKDRSEFLIEKSNSIEIVDRFLELSLAPTVMLFEGLTKMTGLDTKNRKLELVQIFKNVKCYSVVSGFNYRDNFKTLIRKIKLL